MRWIRGKVLIVLLVLVGLFAAYTGGRLTVDNMQRDGAASTLFGWDTSFYFFWLRSAVLDGDIDFENDIRLSDTLPEQEKSYSINRLKRTDTGLIPNKYPVGWAVFHAPWFLAGHGTALGLDKLGVDVRTDGYGTTYEVFLYAGSLFYAALSMWLTYQLLLRFFEKRVAWASLILVWASSFLIFYQLRQYAMAHNLTYLCLVSTFYWIFAIREMPPLKRNWAMLGLSVGMLAITRYQAVVYLLFPFLIAVWELGSRRATLKAAGVCLLSLALPVVLQLFCWKLLYGTWLVYTYEGEGFLWADPAWGKSLFNANHGLIYWHPIFALGLLGLLVFLFSRQLVLSWTWLVSIAAVYYINAAWHCWWFGVSFGNRAYEGVTLFLFFGVAALLKAVEGRPVALKGALWTVLVALAVWNIGVMNVVIYSWITGVGLTGAESFGDLGRAILEFWF
ncbi:hypothetical protein VDG1235_4370 [Verrucomicrobiia bacterium DG1235]|nr:hypothetical protein VDG1235_4370 [Verrucomicrobiae bacterium DG1235]